MTLLCFLLWKRMHDIQKRLNERLPKQNSDFKLGAISDVLQCSAPKVDDDLLICSEGCYPRVIDGQTICVRNDQPTHASIPTGQTSRSTAPIQTLLCAPLQNDPIICPEGCHETLINGATVCVGDDKPIVTTGGLTQLTSRPTQHTLKPTLIHFCIKI